MAHHGKQFWVEYYSDAIGGWYLVQGSLGKKGYATGWYDALTSSLPRPAYRLVKCLDNLETEVLDSAHSGGPVGTA